MNPQMTQKARRTAEHAEDAEIDKPESTRKRGVSIYPSQFRRAEFGSSRDPE